MSQSIYYKVKELMKTKYTKEKFPAPRSFRRYCAIENAKQLIREGK